jgi:hypothetical protein
LVGPSGSIFAETGLIKSLCQISADICNQLETHVLRIEHGGNVANQDVPLETDLPIPEDESLPITINEYLERLALMLTEEHSPASDLPLIRRDAPPPVPANLPVAEGQQIPDVPSLTVVEQPKNRVDEFLAKCNEISGTRIFRSHIWRHIGHRTSRQFEYWQKGDPKTSSSDDYNFNRVLDMNPDEFIASLKRKHLLK